MYNSSLSQLLVQFCELTYKQYQNGPPPGNNGNIVLPPGFTQVASFTAHEIDLKLTKESWRRLPWKDIKSSDEVSALTFGFDKVYFGFAATSANYNVIALRGTQSDFEWMLDADVWQKPVPLGWYNYSFENAKAHFGFLAFYLMLVEQVMKACAKFNPALPCLITGHSLGAALATLLAPSVAITSQNKNVQLYNYASPRLVNPAFVTAFTPVIPESYRIVNLGDLIPIIIATEGTEIYQHIPQEWSFLNQSGTIGGNHALIGPKNYTDAVMKQIPTNAPRVYPVTGLG